MWSERFSEVSGGHTVHTVMGVMEDFELDSEANREPVQSMKNGGDVPIFTHPHHNTVSAILNILELLKALTRDPNEECVTVVQPGGDKCMNEQCFLSCKTVVLAVSATTVGIFAKLLSKNPSYNLETVLLRSNVRYNHKIIIYTFSHYKQI